MRDLSIECSLLCCRDENEDENFKWLDGFTPVNYMNMTNAYKGKKYGLLNKSNGRWITKNSYQPRGLCSRSG